MHFRQIQECLSNGKNIYNSNPFLRGLLQSHYRLYSNNFPPGNKLCIHTYIQIIQYIKMGTHVTMYIICTYLHTIMYINIQICTYKQLYSCTQSCVNVHVIHSHLYHIQTHQYIYSYTSTIYVNVHKNISMSMYAQITYIHTLTSFHTHENTKEFMWL